MAISLYVLYHRFIQVPNLQLSMLVNMSVVVHGIFPGLFALISMILFTIKADGKALTGTQWCVRHTNHLFLSLSLSIC